MRAKKIMNDSFYSNNQKYSGVTSVNSLTSDLYYHFTDTDGNTKKLSGNTADIASGVILEDSYTTSIVLSPTGVTAASGATQQLTVTNQNDINVTTECTFSGTSVEVTVVDYIGLVTLVGPATSTSVVVTHPDIPSSPTTVDITITT